MCACHCQSHRGCIPKEFSIHFKFFTDEEKHFFSELKKKKKTFTSTDDILTLKQTQQSPCYMGSVFLFYLHTCFLIPEVWGFQCARRFKNTPIGSHGVRKPLKKVLVDMTF